MPTKMPASLILLLIALIFSAVMMRFSDITLIALSVNGVLMLGARYMAKIEDPESLISLFMILASLLLTAVIIEPAFASLIVIAIDGSVLYAMRHMAKIEAIETVLRR
jgi:hypothetical protein